MCASQVAIRGGKGRAGAACCGVKPCVRLGVVTALLPAWFPVSRCVPPPIPSSASMARSHCAGGSLASTTPAERARASEASASGGKRVSSPQKVTTGRCPQRCKCMAASNPSPPLLPGPQATQMVCACGARAQASRATAKPARCMRVWGGSCAAASSSICRVAAALCSG